MTDRPYLEFERPIAELEKKISDMRDFSVGEGIEMSGEISSLQGKLKKLREQIYSNLTRWQQVQLSRHPKRPLTLDYLKRITTDFIELHGDRTFGDDKAMIGGFARIGGEAVMIVGQQKGRDTKQKLYHNFGMAHPEGYRKARRLFQLADKYSLPIVVFIDTPGAYPGIEAEERGQAEAIATNIKFMFGLSVPVVVIVIGEGASGGALGIGIGDVILMMRHAWYSVISPEGCAAILWRDASKAPEAAEALKVTSEDLVDLGIIDSVIDEPPGGAHTDHAAAAELVKEALVEALKRLKGIPIEELRRKRLDKYRRMGEFREK